MAWGLDTWGQSFNMGNRDQEWCRRGRPEDRDIRLGRHLGQEEAVAGWIVQFAQMGGASHPSHFLDEERAKRFAEKQLQNFVHVMRRLGSMAAIYKDEGKSKQAESFLEAAAEIEGHLNAGHTWRAYHALKDYQDWVNQEFAADMMFPVEMQMGTMRVIPTPEPE